MITLIRTRAHMHTGVRVSTEKFRRKIREQKGKKKKKISLRITFSVSNSFCSSYILELGQNAPRSRRARFYRQTRADFFQAGTFENPSILRNLT